MSSGFPPRLLVDTALSLARWPYHDHAGRRNALARIGEVLGEAVARRDEPAPDRRCACCAPPGAFGRKA